ncbi:MAG: hypothetical protein NTV22_03380 [bacterium]|nr:hypothetical protein [bacterium]
MFLFCNQQATAACSLPHLLLVIMPRRRSAGSVVLMQAVVKDESGRVIATGHAFEKQGSNYVNRTSYIENCETSAVGRALGILGIGVDTAIASAEEKLSRCSHTEYRKSLHVRHALRAGHAAPEHERPP